MNKNTKLSKKNKVKAIIEILLFLILCVIFIFIRNNTFFYPWNDVSSYQLLKNLEEFEEINITNIGTTLNGWMYYNNSKTKKAPLIVYFAGNAENSSNTMADFLSQWVFKKFEWFNFLMIDYPWFGYSEWTASKKSIFNATNTIYERINNQSNIDNNNIFIMGYSFWTKVAIHYASKYNIKGLILIAPDEIAPLNETSNLYKKILNIFYKPMRWFSKNKLKLRLNIIGIEIKTLIITSYKDKIISYMLPKSENFQKYETISNKNIKHTEYFYQREILDTIKDYISQVSE